MIVVCQRESGRAGGRASEGVRLSHRLRLVVGVEARRTGGTVISRQELSHSL